NLPMTTQVTDEVLVETQALRAQTTLRVEDACDGRIGMFAQRLSPHPTMGARTDTGSHAASARPET
ncbi:hypothetical protein, partial [Paraburkholderia aspalathi]|uniref:hypothetical protein n=1 Tax=Paraburkholderia aspalathi TaxID=1324617 RepID=UPI001BA4A72A